MILLEQVLKGDVLRWVGALKWTVFKRVTLIDVSRVIS